MPIFILHIFWMWGLLYVLSWPLKMVQNWKISENLVHSNMANIQMVECTWVAILAGECIRFGFLWLTVLLLHSILMERSDAESCSHSLNHGMNRLCLNGCVCIYIFMYVSARNETLVWSHRWSRYFVLWQSKNSVWFESVLSAVIKTNCLNYVKVCVMVYRVECVFGSWWSGTV